MKFNENLFTFKGRRNRPSFFVTQIVLATGLYVGIVLTDFNFYTTGHMWIFLASLVPVIWVNLSVTVQRMNDLDISGSWYCLNFVPVLREGFLLYLILRKGTTGPNKNGPDPLAA